MVAQLPEQTKKHCIVQLKRVNCIVYKLHLGRGDKREKERERNTSGGEGRSYVADLQPVSVLEKPHRVLLIYTVGVH